MLKRVGKLVITSLALFALAASAQSLYKYRGENGEWIYADRPPDGGEVEEVRNLVTGIVTGSISVETRTVGREVHFVAINRFYAPIQVALDFTRIIGMDYPHPDAELVWLLAPQSETDLMTLELNGSVAAPEVEYRYEYSAGDPNASHSPSRLYRVPFSTATEFPVTQAYPEVSTHRTPDSYYAVDIAMPIGTDIVAARGGVVFDIAESNFRAGLDPERDGPAANVVRILHDDGTYAIYAHLNWNSIRVRPGDRVTRGQYIADSGNTGFSSGPHLHFAVVHNTDSGTVSVPVTFEGQNSNAVVPRTGNPLTAY